jgi:hypothetical protein
MAKPSRQNQLPWMVVLGIKAHANAIPGVGRWNLLEPVGTCPINQKQVFVIPSRLINSFEAMLWYWISWYFFRVPDSGVTKRSGEGLTSAASSWDR